METVYTVTQSEIKLEKLTDRVKLWLFGDVHRDATSCDVDRWKWFLSEARRQHDDTTYYLGCGDYHDFASASEQKHLKSGKLHEETINRLDMSVERDNRKFAREISFMRGKVIGMIEGNHTWVFQNGKTATEDLCERMLAQYMGWLNHHTIRFSFADRGSAFINVYIVTCHGRAGGKTAGNSVNQLDDLRDIFPVADLYIMGHDHQRLARPVSVLIPKSNNYGKTVLKQKRQFLCRSGSFKKGYTEGVSSYEVGRLLRPADIGALRLEISFHRDQKDGCDRMITDITAIV